MIPNKVLTLIQSMLDQYWEDVEIYGSNPKYERKLRKVRDILRTMV